MRWQQRTLRGSTEAVAGLQLDQDRVASVRFHPARVGAGVVFARADLPGRPEVRCQLENLRAEPRWSSLEQDGVVVQHTEHVLAALRGLGVDNAVVEVDGDRLPVVTGGSCAGFCAALQAAGLQAQEAPRCVYRLVRPVHEHAALDVPAPGTEARQRAARRWVVGQPADALAVSYVLHVPGVEGMRVGLAEFDEAQQAFYEAAGADAAAGLEAPCLGQARTYFLRVEGPELVGLLSSAQREYIILDRDSPQAHVDEVARHKIVDFIGDLHLLGRPVVGRFVAFRTGHRFHHQLLRALVAGGHVQLVELEGR